MSGEDDCGATWPDPAIVAITVPDDAHGTRLDRFLAAPLGSRARAQALIDAGRVSVDGRPRAKRHPVSGGERIEVDGRVDPPDGEAVEVPFVVAYEDEHLLVVDKPAGVVVHPARGHRTGTLSQSLAGRGVGGDQPWRAGLVHRLDRDTSGLLVVAKSDPVHRALKQLLSQRQIRREYLALVSGHPAARTATIDAPIGRDRRDRVRMSIDTDVPRDARTHFELERLLAGTALLRVMLETGRTHQIRVHLAAIGNPVCGDPTYGMPGAYGLQRQFLHAQRLAFVHPITAAALDLRSPLPADLARALQLAEAEGQGSRPQHS